ncbi:hypothetical protein BTVI_155076 [Pitangus sulphuratus]|nr:hypothetical protein BTVI_155076 [Pitangus sulphuratus]
MGEGGERRAAEPDRLALELGREKRRKQMLEISIFELRNTVAELEERLNCVEDEGNEWKTRYETQVELNKQLERQINILQDKVELIRGKPAAPYWTYSRKSDLSRTEESRTRSSTSDMSDQCYGEGMDYLP